MNNLTVINHNGILLVDSRQVAAMVDRNHGHLLRDIKVYIDILTQSNFGFSGFFNESTYQDSTGRTLPCYLLTRKGCDMVANKMTGEKGVLFTAAYVTRFEEMEKELFKPMSNLEILQMAINHLVEHDTKLNQTNKRVHDLTENVGQLKESFDKYTIRIGDKSAYIVARELSLYSRQDKPHFNFVDAVAKKLGIYSGILGEKNDLINVIMDNTHNGTSGIAVYYTDKTVELMKDYLDENFELKIDLYKRNVGMFKKGDPKDFVFRLGEKDWGFHKRTYAVYA